MDLQTTIFLFAKFAGRVRVVTHAWALLYYRTRCASKVFCIFCYSYAARCSDRLCI